MKKIAVLGLGYVGLCTAVCFARKGFRVIGVDVDPKTVKMITQKKTPIHEPRLARLLKTAVDSQCLTCTTDYERAINTSDMSFIAVGTPYKPSIGMDPRYVKSVAKSIGKALRTKKGYHMVVVKSTVLPGTTEGTVKPLIEKCSGKRCGSTFDICYNPEFLREGSAIEDVFKPDRIVIGEFNQGSGDRLESFYRKFHEDKMPKVIRTNPSTAELIKYANNAFLATKVSFINTMANICQEIPGADVTVVAKAIGLDNRINPLFLNAGLGYGGSCLPKDLKTLISFSPKLGYEPSLLKTVDEVNIHQSSLATKLVKGLLGTTRGKRIAILGLAFKPNTDDLRDAVSLEVIKELLKEEAEVVVYDPAALENAKNLFKNKVKYATSAFECIHNADCCIIVTEWPEFKTLKCKDFIKQMRTPTIVDGRRIYNPEEFGGKLKFAAIGLGRRKKDD
jgi:UDPglucose 6-dehydrogenase